MKIGSPGRGELSEIRPQAGNAAQAKWQIKAAKLLVRGLFRLLFRVRVLGLKNLPPTPVIICANHLGWTDPFLVLLFLPVEPRIYVLGLDPTAISGFRMRVVGALEVMVALDLTKPLKALRASEDVLRRGGSLLIFPEGGTLSAQEGRLLELQHGAAHLAQVNSVPLLPIGITGTKELWLRRTLTLRIGKPIQPSAFEGDMRPRTHAMTTRLHADMSALLPGDHERPRFKPLNRWLTRLFF